MANVSYVEIDPTLKQVIQQLRVNLDEDDWMLPAFTGDLEDPEALRKIFNVDQLNVATAKAVSNSKSPGSAGDMIAGPLQVDLLQSLQRALLFRHCYPWSRCVLLARGRDKAQADPQGPLASQLDYLQNILKQERGEGV